MRKWDGATIVACPYHVMAARDLKRDGWGHADGAKIRIMRTKKASGRNVREDERGTVQVKLRLPPDVAEDLDGLAARWKMTRSGAVARLLEERDRSSSRVAKVGE